MDLTVEPQSPRSTDELSLIAGWLNRSIDDVSNDSHPSSSSRVQPSSVRSRKRSSRRLSSRNLSHVMTEAYQALETFSESLFMDDSNETTKSSNSGKRRRRSSTNVRQQMATRRINREQERSKPSDYLPEISLPSRSSSEAGDYLSPLQEKALRTEKPGDTSSIWGPSTGVDLDASAHLPVFSLPSYSSETGEVSPREVEEVEIVASREIPADFVNNAGNLESGSVRVITPSRDKQRSQRVLESTELEDAPDERDTTLTRDRTSPTSPPDQPVQSPVSDQSTVDSSSLQNGTVGALSGPSSAQDNVLGSGGKLTQEDPRYPALGSEIDPTVDQISPKEQRVDGALTDASGDRRDLAQRTADLDTSLRNLFDESRLEELNNRDKNESVLQKTNISGPTRFSLMDTPLPINSSRSSVKNNLSRRSRLEEQAYDVTVEPGSSTESKERDCSPVPDNAAGDSGDDKSERWSVSPVNDERFALFRRRKQLSGDRIGLTSTPLRRLPLSVSVPLIDNEQSVRDRQALVKRRSVELTDRRRSRRVSVVDAVESEDNLEEEPSATSSQPAGNNLGHRTSIPAAEDDSASSAESVQHHDGGQKTVKSAVIYALRKSLSYSGEVDRSLQQVHNSQSSPNRPVESAETQPAAVASLIDVSSDDDDDVVDYWPKSFRQSQLSVEIESDKVESRREVNGSGRISNSNKSMARRSLKRLSVDPGEFGRDSLAANSVKRTSSVSQRQSAISTNEASQRFSSQLDTLAEFEAELSSEDEDVHHEAKTPLTPPNDRRIKRQTLQVLPQSELTFTRRWIRQNSGKLRFSYDSLREVDEFVRKLDQTLAQRLQKRRDLNPFHVVRMLKSTGAVKSNLHLHRLVHELLPPAERDTVIQCLLKYPAFTTLAN